MRFLVNWLDNYHELLSTVIEAQDGAHSIDVSNDDQLVEGLEVEVYPISESHRYVEWFSSPSFSAVVIEGRIRLPISSLKELPELEIAVQRRIPEANEYLRRYNENLAENVLKNMQRVELHTSIGGIIHHETVDLHNSGDFFTLNIEVFPRLKQQLPFLSAVSVSSNVNDRFYYFEMDIELEGSEVKLYPLKMTYGAQSPLETHVFSRKQGVSDVFSRTAKFMKYWFFAFRSPQYAITFLSIVMSLLLVLRSISHVDLRLTFLIILGTYCVQAGGNLLNDFFDYRSQLDDINIQSTSSLSSTKFVKERLIHPQVAVSIGFFLFIVGTLVGLYLNSVSPGNAVLYLGIVGAVTTYFYTGEPIKLAYRGIGEFILAMNFGPFIIFGTFYVLVGSFPDFLDLITFGLPPLLIISGLLILNALDDIEADKLVCKTTTPVRLGRRNSILLVIILVVAAVAISTVVTINTQPNPLLPLAVLGLGLVAVVQPLVSELLETRVNVVNLVVQYSSIYFFWTTAMALTLIY